MQITAMKARRGESEGSGFKSLCQTKEFFSFEISVKVFLYNHIALDFLHEICVKEY